MKKKRKEKKLKEYKGKLLYGKMISEIESVMSVKFWLEGVMSVKFWFLVERRKDICNLRISVLNKLGKEEYWKEGCEWKMLYVLGEWDEFIFCLIFECKKLV